MGTRGVSPRVASRAAQRCLPTSKSEPPTGMDVFFCDPASPRQRDTNENTDGLLREYFPKGTACQFTAWPTSSAFR